MLEPEITARLARIRTIDLTTIGRRSAQSATVEIWWFHFEDRFIVTGTPGPRDWYANVLANQSVTVQARDGARGVKDFPGRASIVDDQAFRRRFFTDKATRWYSTQAQLEALVETAPMIEIDFS